MKFPLRGKMNWFVIVVVATMLFSALTVMPVAGAFTIEPGNTLIYEVTVFNVPFEQLSTQPGLEMLSAFKGIDLVGSQIYVKILRTDPLQGWYTVGLGGLLGKNNVINLTALFPPDAGVDPIQYGLDLSNTLIQAGSGGYLAIPEIKMWNYFDFVNGRSGLFYLDQDRWDDHESALIAQYGSNVTITNGADEFIARFGNATDFVELTWFKTGNDAGILKSIKVQTDVTLEDGTIANISIVISFASRQTRVLPNVSTLVFLLEQGDFQYTATGNFTEDPGKDLENFKNNLTQWVGKDFIKYEIGNKDGLFYTADIYLPVDFNDTASGLFKAQTLVFNGFNGAIYEKDWQDNRYSPMVGGPMVTMPLLLSPLEFVLKLSGPGSTSAITAPLVTPDWELREGQVILTQSFLKTVETILTSQQFEDEVLKGLGITLNSLKLDAAYQETADFVYMIVNEEVDLVIDGAQFYANTTGGQMSGQGSMTMRFSRSSWVAYSKNGELAAMAISGSFQMTANNFGYQSNMELEPQLINGDLSVDLFIKLKNKNHATVPSPEQVTSSSASAGAPGAITPGFEAPLLLTFVLLPISFIVIIRKRRPIR